MSDPLIARLKKENYVRFEFWVAPTSSMGSVITHGPEGLLMGDVRILLQKHTERETMRKLDP